jgi:hypothetical protein
MLLKDMERFDHSHTDMPIQRTAAPGGMANMLAFLPAPVAPRRGGFEAKDLKTAAPSTFWAEIFLESGASWPAIQDATVRVAQVIGGFVFSIEDATGLLLLGGGAVEKGGPAWEALQEMVFDFRRHCTDGLLRSKGGAELMASWEHQPLTPATGPWMVLIPMIGLRYYTPEAERILHLATELGQDLLTRCDLGNMPQ